MTPLLHLVCTVSIATIANQVASSSWSCYKPARALYSKWAGTTDLERIKYLRSIPAMLTTHAFSPDNTDIQVFQAVSWIHKYV